MAALAIRAVGAALILFAASAPAQITSYRTNNPAPIKGDADKIVCEKEEKIGTRLGARKICLTVSEWEAREQVHREQTEKIQMGVCVPFAGCDPG